MANRTFGSSALKDDDLFESGDRGEIKSRSKIINIDDYKKIEDINGTKISSIKEAIAALENLKKIDGNLKKGGILERGIENYLGPIKIDDVSEIIDDLVKFEVLSSDKFNTSSVPVEKINELVEDYEKYLEKGLSDSQALEQIYKDNKGKISAKEIEKFVQEQREIYQEKIKTQIEEKASKIAEELIEKNENLKDKNKIKEIVKKAILEEEKTISEELGNNSLIKEVDLEIKKFSKENKELINDFKIEELGKNIREEIYKENQNLNTQQKSEVEDYVDFAKNFYKSEEVIDRNIGEAINYSKNQGLGDGQIEVGVEKLDSFIKLIENPEPISDLVKNYKTITDKIGWKLPINIKECDNLDALFNLANKSEKFEKLIGTTQKILHPGNTLIGVISKKIGLDKILIGTTGKLFGAAGGEFVKNSLVILSQKPLEQGSFIILQSFIGGGVPALSVTAATVTFEAATATATAANAALTVANATAIETTATALAAVGTTTEAATAALAATATTQVTEAAIAAEAANLALKTASTTLASVSATAGTSATGIGTAALTGMVPIVGWALTALMAVSAILKPAFDKVKNFLSSIGLNFTQGIKNFLSENFGILGKFASYVINLAEDLTIIVGAAFATVTTTVIVIIAIVFGGLFGYQTYLGSSISSLVPPKGAVDYADEESDENNNYSPGEPNYWNINVPRVPVNFTRQDLLNVAFSLRKKVTYFWAGEWNHYGNNPDWGIVKKYVYCNDPTRHFTCGTWVLDGLDCSGYVLWLYYQLTGTVISGHFSGLMLLKAERGEWQFIDPANLKAGDIAYRRGHVAIFIGLTPEGNRLFIHSYTSKWPIDITSDTTRYEGKPATAPFTHYLRPNIKFYDDE